MDETRENREAAERLIPGAVELGVKGVSDAVDAAYALGNELMQPMPPGWFRSEYEQTDGSWEVVAATKEPEAVAWSDRRNFVAAADGATLTEAHRLCREQAWAKHRKNTEGA